MGLYSLVKKHRRYKRRRIFRHQKLPCNPLYKYRADADEGCDGQSQDVMSD
jgi:hypothetical protein